ncbi:MAG: Aspartate aminotransferase (EC [uncultured Sulfurovum sp.]|uniref:Aspartate aminotransferase (EC) n=1 Tax=uncultured Sulfurovum sp. TaxID=269237 RepID=A0A6S6T8D3_9BACT|nr:MAG: Aspartate aminotransferase (EC [uncultured Sulfurovum sp.]
MVNYAGGISVIINTDDSSGFKMTAEQLKAAITPKTKMLVLTSPSNPTGAVYSESELRALAEVLKDTNILVASDEMYEKLVFDNIKFVATASISEDMFERTITINGLSKSAAMTGWRFGYMASAKTELIAAMNKLQSQSTSNINSITQDAAIVGLNGTINEEVETMRVAFEARCAEATNLFNAVDGLSVVKPNGAFYLFVNIKKVSNNSMQFCKDLLEDQGVAVVPGIGFGAEGYFRFSYATDIETIKEGVRRIEAFVQKQK